ncbi:MAG: zinc ribbon domain-containing protein [Candidatus Micrarchaeia archaeon]
MIAMKGFGWTCFLSFLRWLPCFSSIVFILLRDRFFMDSSEATAFEKLEKAKARLKEGRVGGPAKPLKQQPVQAGEGGAVVAVPSLVREEKLLPSAAQVLKPVPSAPTPIPEIKTETETKSELGGESAPAPAQALAPPLLESGARELQPQRVPEKKGFLSFLFGGKKREAAPREQQARPVELPAALPPQPVAVPEKITPPEAAAAVLRRVRETEAEAVLRDVVGEALKEAAAQEAAPAGGKAEQPVVHRRYLLARQQKQASGGTPVQQPAKAEEQMFGEVYAQYKAIEPPAKPEEKPEEKKAGGREERISPREARRRAQEKEAEKPVEEKKQLSFEELLGAPAVAPAKPASDLFAQLSGSAPAPAAPSKEGGLFAELGAISSAAPKEAGKGEGVAAAPAEKEEGGVVAGKAGEPVKPSSVTTCPTCGTKNIRVVFCPYCGTGMCANCSPSVTLTDSGFVYVCPKCGEEVTVSKK